MGGSAVQCTVSAGPLAPMRCACEGPGLAAARCGEPASFTIAAADAFGNRRGGADDFVVSVACLDTGGAAPVAARVEDLGRGSYRARPKTLKHPTSCKVPTPEHLWPPAALLSCKLPGHGRRGAGGRARGGPGPRQLPGAHPAKARACTAAFPNI